ncbi:MAG: MotA/TolQ/ExbB proton channel family protein [Pseudomonadota bacterium]
MELQVLTVGATGMAEVTTEQAFSMIELLMAADPVVKAVLIALVIASIWSWAVVAEKLFAIGGARKKTREFEEAFWNGRADEYEIRPGQSPDNAGARLFASISREWQDARNIHIDQHGPLVARAERSLRATVDREVGRVSNGIGALATIGSASPFIGLFGTVWGIMNAFLNISAQEDTSLAVVGGPIAEALFATGLGLIAAIPAVIFYNKFSGDLNRYADSLDAFSQDLLVRLSRRASDGPV